MGAWGPALFSDDLACDVRDEYRGLIEDGIDDDAATRQILNSQADALNDPDEGPVVWLALAVTQLPMVHPGESWVWPAMMFGVTFQWLVLTSRSPLLRWTLF